MNMFDPSYFSDSDPSGRTLDCYRQIAVCASWMHHADLSRLGPAPDEAVEAIEEAVLWLLHFVSAMPGACGSLPDIIEPVLLTDPLE
jgi:hypothetical protein